MSNNPPPSSDATDLHEADLSPSSILTQTCQKKKKNVSFYSATDSTTKRRREKRNASSTELTFSSVSQAFSTV